METITSPDGAVQFIRHDDGAIEIVLLLVVPETEIFSDVQ
jgi:hypothetical protein